MSDTSNSTEAELVATTVSPEGVATVRLQHGKVNALSQAVLTQVAAAFEGLRGQSVGAVVLTGGPKLFAAGADLTEFGGTAEDGEFRLHGAENAGNIADLFTAAAAAIESCECPTIAASSGFALGGGCELALACDLRVGSTKAVLGQPEILLGIIPGGGGTQRLPRLIGASRALDLIVTGRQVAAEEALQLGLLNRVFQAEEFDEQVEAFATSLARGPREAIALSKRAINDGLRGSLVDGLAVERDAFCEVFTTADAAVGVHSFQTEGPGKAVLGQPS